jgi:hypothetical protein
MTSNYGACHEEAAKTGRCSRTSHCCLVSTIPSRCTRSRSSTSSASSPSLLSDRGPHAASASDKPNTAKSVPVRPHPAKPAMPQPRRPQSAQETSRSYSLCGCPRSSNTTALTCYCLSGLSRSPMIGEAAGEMRCAQCTAMGCPPAAARSWPTSFAKFAGSCDHAKVAVMVVIGTTTMPSHDGTPWRDVHVITNSPREACGLPSLRSASAVLRLGAQVLTCPRCACCVPCYYKALMHMGLELSLG